MGIPEPLERENQEPGVKNLEIIVNSSKFGVTKLDDNKEATIDISSDMLSGENNTITLVACGTFSCNVNVIIHD
jgi:hypothetical protein